MINQFISRLSAIELPRWPGLALSCVLLTLAIGVSAQANRDTEKISAKEMTKKTDALQPTVYYGGLMISAGQTISGPVVIIDGPLDIQGGGVLEGDAWVVNGSLVLTGDARVTGRAHLVNSDDYASHTATVAGGVAYYNCECAIDAERYEKDRHLVFIKEEDPLAIKTRFAGGVAHPTRVRYDVARLGLKHGNDRLNDPHIKWEAMITVPLFEDTQHGFFNYDATVWVPLGGNDKMLTLRGYKALHTEDNWQVSRTENALLLVLVAQEFANYYEKRGGSVSFDWKLGDAMSAGLTALFQKDLSMQKTKTWSLFGSGSQLPPNPPIDEGTRWAGRLALTYDTREDGDYPIDAWLFGAAIEAGHVDPDAEEAFDYTAFTLEADRYTRLPLGLQWDIGARLSSSFDRIPTQLYQTLNGYGGVRGTENDPYPYVRADRLIRISTELRTGLPDVPIVRWIYETWDLLLFADAGLLAPAANPTSVFGFLDAPFEDWVKSVGAGVSGESFFPYLGFYVAQEIKGNRTKPRFIVRLERSF